MHKKLPWGKKKFVIKPTFMESGASPWPVVETTKTTALSSGKLR